MSPSAIDNISTIYLGDWVKLKFSMLRGGGGGGRGIKATVQSMWQTIVIMLSLRQTCHDNTVLPTMEYNIHWHKFQWQYYRQKMKLISAISCNYPWCSCNTVHTVISGHPWCSCNTVHTVISGQSIFSFKGNHTTPTYQKHKTLMFILLWLGQSSCFRVTDFTIPLQLL